MGEHCKVCGERNNDCKCKTANGVANEGKVLQKSPEKEKPPCRECRHCHYFTFTYDASFCFNCGKPLDEDILCSNEQNISDGSPAPTSANSYESDENLPNPDKNLQKCKEEKGQADCLNKIFGASTDVVSVSNPPLPTKEEGKTYSVDELEGKFRSDFKILTPIPENVEHSSNVGQPKLTTVDPLNAAKDGSVDINKHEMIDVDEVNKTSNSLACSKSYKDSFIRVLAYTNSNLLSSTNQSENQSPKTDKDTNQKRHQNLNVPSSTSYADVTKGNNAAGASSSKANLQVPSSAIDTFSEKNCRIVHFAVFVAPDFNFSTEKHDIYIMFGHPWLGGWRELRYRMKYISFIENYAVMALNVRIPFDILTTEYKYLKVLKDHNKGEYEYLHYSYNPYENRRLNFHFFKDSQYVYCFDNCIEPEKVKIEKSVLQILKQKVKSLFSSSSSETFEKIKADSALAFEYFWPKWSPSRGFYVPYDCNDLTNHCTVVLNVEQVIGRMNDILSRFGNCFYSDYNRLDKEAVWNVVIVWLERRLKDVDDLTPVKRMEFGCILLHVCYLIANQGKMGASVPVLIEICKLFTLDANIKMREYQLEFMFM